VINNDSKNKKNEEKKYFLQKIFAEMKKK